MTQEVTMYMIPESGMYQGVMTQFKNGVEYRSGKTEYDTPNKSVTLYLQKQKCNMAVIFKMRSTTVKGIDGFHYCAFGDGYVDYYSLKTGLLVSHVSLAYWPVLGPSNFYPTVDINGNKVVYTFAEDGYEVAGIFERGTDGSFSMIGKVRMSQTFYNPNKLLFAGTTGPFRAIQIPYTDVDPGGDRFLINQDPTEPGYPITLVQDQAIWMQSYDEGPGGVEQGTVRGYFVRNPTETSFQIATEVYDHDPFVEPVDITSQGNHYHTFTGAGVYGYHSNNIRENSLAIIPSKFRNGNLYVNFGTITGMISEEIIPDMSDINSDKKRLILSKTSLLVGDLAPGNGRTKKIQFLEFLPEDYPDRSLYTFEIDVLDEIGATLLGNYYNNSLYITIYYDDGSQEWYNSSGTWIYDWNPPIGFDYVSARVDYGSSFYYVIANSTTNESYLVVYSLTSGAEISRTLLNNPYTSTEGYYKLSNNQIINNKYIMVHTTNGHNMFFEIASPLKGIMGEITLPIANNYTGFYVVPQITV